MKNDFKKFFQGLDNANQVQFALEAKTTVGYIKTHLIYGRKIPKPKLFNRLADCCEKFESGITRSDLFNFFYSEDKKVA